jgi:hypothetical protein
MVDDGWQGRWTGELDVGSGLRDVEGSGELRPGKKRRVI